jgi:YVTN family beta-propeller protein
MPLSPPYPSPANIATAAGQPNYIYVTHQTGDPDGGFTVYDTTSGTAVWGLGDDGTIEGLLGVAATSDGSYLYAAAPQSGPIGQPNVGGGVAVFNSGTPWGEVTFINTGTSVQYLADVTAGGNEYMYASSNTQGNPNTGWVHVIDVATNTVVKTITVGNSPVGLAANADGTAVVVANYADGTVSVINTATNQVVQKVNVNGHPYGVAFDNTSGLFYVTIPDSNSVAVISIAPMTG